MYKKNYIYFKILNFLSLSKTNQSYHQMKNLFQPEFHFL